MYSVKQALSAGNPQVELHPSHGHQRGHKERERERERERAGGERDKDNQKERERERERERQRETHKKQQKPGHTERVGERNINENRQRKRENEKKGCSGFLLWTFFFLQLWSTPRASSCQLPSTSSRFLLHPNRQETPSLEAHELCESGFQVLLDRSCVLSCHASNLHPSKLAAHDLAIQGSGERYESADFRRFCCQGA